jgi:hypothetical protein
MAYCERWETWRLQRRQPRCAAVVPCGVVCLFLAVWWCHRGGLACCRAFLCKPKHTSALHTCGLRTYGAGPLSWATPSDCSEPHWCLVACVQGKRLPTLGTHPVHLVLRGAFSTSACSRCWLRSGQNCVTCPAVCLCAGPAEAQRGRSDSPKAVFSPRVAPRCVLFSEHLSMSEPTVSSMAPPLPQRLSPPSHSFAAFADQHLPPTSRLSSECPMPRARSRLVPSPPPPWLFVHPL